MIKPFPHTVASYRGHIAGQKADLVDIALPGPIEEKLGSFASEFNEQERLFLRHLVNRLLLKDPGEQAKIVTTLHGTDKTIFSKMFSRAAEFMREMERPNSTKIDQETQNNKSEENSKPPQASAPIQSSIQSKKLTAQEEKFVSQLFTMHASTSPDVRLKIMNDLYGEDHKLFSNMFDLVGEQIKNGIKTFADMKATLG